MGLVAAGAVTACAVGINQGRQRQVLPGLNDNCWQRTFPFSPPFIEKVVHVLSKNRVVTAEL